jgi:hypothetical protein
MKKRLPLFVMYISFLFTISVTSCSQQSGLAYCIKGQYVGSYCSGSVINILDKTGIGKTWKGQDGTNYTNAVVASIDSIYIKSVVHPDNYFKQGTIFYFKYRDGGYPRLEYNLCEPAPFITITYLSLSPCQ